MKIQIASITSRRAPKSDPCEALVRDYVQRATRYLAVEAVSFPTESAFLLSAERRPGSPAAAVMLCDSTGELPSSGALAEALRTLRDASTPRLLLGIGPADGWSQAALARNTRTISFGRITLPHELARVVLAEQVYRALTILAGHPYHFGH